METGVVVFARMDSRRLPGKALCGIGGRPMLGRVLDRARRCGAGARPIVATSDRALDDPIAAFACAEAVEVFRGDVRDVAGRALACALQFRLAHLVRISGDSPFVPAEIATRMIGSHAHSGADLTTNIDPRSYPAGASVEVIATPALRRAVAAMDDEDEREHVTLHFYRNRQAFRIDNHAVPAGRYAGLHLAVDTAEDRDRAAAIAEALGSRAAEATIEEVAALARAWDTAHVADLTQ